jgi:PAS domain S-box-containing protein
MQENSNYTVLIVDDNATQLKLLNSVLKSEGYQVLQASCASEALATLASQLPDLMITDITMPKMSGFELCNEIKRDQSLQTLPVVLLSALSEPADIFQGLSVGGDSYIIKPYNEKNLLEKIKYLLQIPKQVMRNSLKEFARIEYDGKLYDIHSDSPRIIRFLLSTYENAIYNNKELVETQLALEEKACVLKKQFNLLQASEQRFETLVELIPDIAYRVDENGIFVYVNNAVSHLGYQPSDLVGKHFSVMMTPSDVEQVSRNSVLKKWTGKNMADKDAPLLFDERRSANRCSRTLEMRLLCKDNKTKNHLGRVQIIAEDPLEVEINSSGFYLASGNATEKKFVGTVGVIRDITERKNNEMAQYDSEKSLAEAQRIAHVGNWDWDIINNKITWSDEIYRIFGFKIKGIEASYDAYLNAIHPEDRDLVEAAINNVLHGVESAYNIEHRVVHPNGTSCVVHQQAEVILDNESKPLHMIGTIQDITKRKQLEDQLYEYQMNLESKVYERTKELEKAMTELKATQQHMFQSEKLSSLGTLAAGVAHEMNNPIMGIINYVEFAKNRIKDERGHEMLGRAENELHRVANIIKGMLSFSHNSNGDLSPIDVTEPFRHALQLLAADLRHQKIEIVEEIAQNLPKVMAKVDGLEQVFLNLLVNARDAMKNFKEKRIHVKINQQDDTLLINVCDSGGGIEEHVLANIFDPFYTTKAAGEGTGLGLYISRNLINNFQGELSCESKYGSGTCFIISLPCIK